MTLLIYEDSWQGFLSAVFEAFTINYPVSLQNDSRYDGFSLFESRQVPGDAAKASRVERGMYGLSRDLPSVMYTVWLTEFPGIEDRMLEVLRLGFSNKTDPLAMRQIDCVKTVMDAHHRIGFEAQRFRGYVRFLHAGGDLYVSDIKPDCNILPIIAEHFHDRFRDQRFIIRDIGRRTAIVSDMQNWELVKLPEETPPLPDGGEFEEMWKQYFKTIANQARVNKMLQRQFVPKKYRENLTEFRE